MNEDLKQEDPLQEVRLHLLRFYSDKCTAHATNILTVAIAFFAYVEVSGRMLLPFNLLWKYLVNSFFITVLATVGTYQIFRLLWWALLTTQAMRRNPEILKNTKPPLLERKLDTPMWELDITCHKYLSLSHEEKVNSGLIPKSSKRSLMGEMKVRPVVWVNTNRWALFIFWAIFFVIAFFWNLWIYTN